MNFVTSSIFIALPALNELDYLPAFIDCLKNQSYKEFKLLVCINQPDDWWDKEDKLDVCLNNRKSINFLNSLENLNIEIIDRSSKGKGWKGKNFGVGWARKSIMDQISSTAGDSDIIVSLDADTTFGTDYLRSIIQNFAKHHRAVAISVPYFHQLSGDEEKDRAILRYEIYMRYYSINMKRIGSPYHFTAIGSAIALPVKSYKAIGGITPFKSGEDFYFLQKLRKYGSVITRNKEKVYPAARYSDRVNFGTGPAMINGRTGNWSSYPIYNYEYFDEIKQTYELFTELFYGDIPTPLDSFISEKFGENIWQPLRKNYKTEEQFIKACFNKIDGFRVFQYLKWRHKENNQTDEEKLIQYFEKFLPDKYKEIPFDFNNFSFGKSAVEDLNYMRDLLVRVEDEIEFTEPTKNEIKENIRHGLKELHLIEQGKLKTRPAKKFLNEL